MKVKVNNESTAGAIRRPAVLAVVASILAFGYAAQQGLFCPGGMQVFLESRSNSREKVVQASTAGVTGGSSKAESAVVVDMTALPVQDQVTQCRPITAAQTAALQSEIKDYEGSKRYTDKLKEVKGEVGVAAHHMAINKYLKEQVLQPGWSVLELGCAAGMMLKMVEQAYADGIGNHKELVGVELVTGWVKFAQSYHKEIKIYEGDITEFSLPEPYAQKTFDLVMLNDVAEHIQKERYGCFFANLKTVTHPGSIVYMHTPTPQAQLADKDQYLENVLPHHYVVMGMALAGFELITFEHDLDTMCGSRGSQNLPKTVRGVNCMFNKWPKYYHVLFRKTSKDVLTLS